jgi:hypothetical protein
VIEFQKYPKTPRLFRKVIATEKIDGTNSGIQIVLEPEDDGPVQLGTHVTVDGVSYAVAAQSRNRLITPGKATDNHGFAGWVYDNAEMLVRTLGPGIHFGEWWGQGIQRRYDMDYKKFSLFNVSRWGHLATESPSKHLGVVPELWSGPMSTRSLELVKINLQIMGSVAAPGFMDPEGVIAYHVASGQTFKYTIVNDEEPKGKGD